MNHGFRYNRIGRFRESELLVHPGNSFFHFLTKMFKFAIPSSSIIAAHSHSKAATLAVAVLHRLRVSIVLATSLAQVRPTLEVSVGSVLQIDFHGIQVCIHRLGVPYTATEFRPALLQFALVMAVFPHSQKPVRSFQRASHTPHATVA